MDELRGRGDIQLFRVEVPGPKVTRDIASDANLMDDMIVQIPEALTALYLLCNAPDEKPAILKPRHH